MIEVQNISFCYEDAQGAALSGLSFTLAPGEWMTVLGANGSGKSTMARHLNGLLLPGRGQVLVDGESTLKPQSMAKIRQKVAFVFQNPDNQIVATTVEDDIAFGPENLGLAPEEIQRRVENALEITELSPLRQKPPHLLSGGEKQRLAIAGALAMEAPYLVLDEPTSMLDPQMRRQVLDTLVYLHRELGKGILYISNLMEEALLSQSLLILSQGRLMAQGTPREIFHDCEALREWGLEPPLLHRLRARLMAAGFHELKGALTLEEMVDCLWASW